MNDIPSANWPAANEALAILARDALSSKVTPGVECAMLDYPDHANVGDSAIWLGERIFARKQGLRVRYTCNFSTYSGAALRARLRPGSLVLLHGGGNFGSVWPEYQRFRERLLNELGDYRIVQLPQTVYFDTEESAKSTREAIARHPDFTLFVRDAKSQDFARRVLGAESALCIDSAVLLAGQLNRADPQIDCLFLGRTDKEQQGLAEVDRTLFRGMSIEVHDWLDEDTTKVQFAARVLKNRRVLPRSDRFSWFQRALLSTWDALAQERVDRGCALLSRGKVVVTDRLHAHILSTLLGIPNIVLDNNYGKLSSFRDAWTLNHPLSQVARTTAEALELAARHVPAPPN